MMKDRCKTRNRADLENDTNLMGGIPEKQKRPISYVKLYEKRETSVSIREQ